MPIYVRKLTNFVNQYRPLKRPAQASSPHIVEKISNKVSTSGTYAICKLGVRGAFQVPLLK